MQKWVKFVCGHKYKTTLVVHSRNHEEVGMAHEITLSQNQSKTTMGRHWLGKPSLETDAFKSYNGILKNYLTEFSTN